MNTIDVSGPMARAFQNGDDTYHPVFLGTELELEHDQQTKSTLRNLDAIVARGEQIAMFLLGVNQVLVCFSNGNQYLATGFGYGHAGEEVYQLALFAAKHGFGDKDEIFAYLSLQVRPGDTGWLMKPPPVSHDCVENFMEGFNGQDIRPQPHIL